MSQTQYLLCFKHILRHVSNTLFARSRRHSPAMFQMRYLMCFKKHYSLCVTHLSLLCVGHIPGVRPQTPGMAFLGYLDRYGWIWTKFQPKPTIPDPNRDVFVNY